MNCKYPRLRELRNAGKFTQKQVSRYIHYSIQAYSCYESGKLRMPSYVLIRLAEFHHTSADYLLGLTDVQQPYPGKNQKKKKGMKYTHVCRLCADPEQSVRRGRRIGCSRIRDLREDSDLTQAQVGNYLNCSQKAYSNYERGVADISVNMLIRLALLYHTSVDYLLEITDEKNPYRRRKT